MYDTLQMRELIRKREREIQEKERDIEREREREIREKRKPHYDDYIHCPE